MANIKAIIADDEPLSLRRLEIALQDHKDIEVVGSAGDGLAALELIRAHRPDLIFLDIRMPGLSGLELVEAVDPSILPAIVFVSAFNHFAVDAFGVNAIDYLLKPLDTERLDKAMARVRSALEDRHAKSRVAELSDLVAAIRSGEEGAEPAYAQFLWITLRDRIVRIAAREVIWVEAAGDYVIAHTAEQDYLMPDSLRDLEQRLDPRLFVRVHRGRIVNRSFVVEVLRLKFGKTCLRLESGEIVSVGRSYRHQLQRILVAADAG